MSDSDVDFESADEGDDAKRETSSLPPSVEFAEVGSGDATSALFPKEQRRDHRDGVVERVVASPDPSEDGIISESKNAEPDGPLSEKVATEPDHSASDRSPVGEEEEPKSTLNVASKDASDNIASLFDKFSNIGESSERPNNEEASLWGWSSWGASFVSKAATSVSTLTSQFGEGIQALGIPDPQEFAQRQHEEDERRLQDEPSNENRPIEIGSSENDASLFSSFYSFSNVIEKTGSAVLNTGLGTLELIGKKTMDVLQDGDPGLKKKMAFFHEPKPNLSEVLRDAQNKNNEADATQAKNKINYNVLFDEYHGLIHLEALEMLSKEKDDELSALLKRNCYADELMQRVREIDELCKLEDFDDTSVDDDNFSTVKEPSTTLQVKSNLKISRLQEIHESAIVNFQEFDTEFEAETPPTPEELHCEAIKTLADFTAASMEYLHKLAEHVVLDETYADDLTERACSALKLLCHEVNYLSSRYSEYLYKPTNDDVETPENSETLSSLTTEINLEACNSVTYLQDALQLLCPILQLTLLASHLKNAATV